MGARWGKGASSLSTNKVAILIEAAISGEGIMLGWHHIMSALVANGQLVCAHPATLSAGRGIFLKCQKTALERPAAARFVEYLLQSLSS